MNCVLSSNDMIGCIFSFLKLKNTIVLLNVSKKYRNTINSFLWKKYKICINNLYKKKCIDCHSIDLYSIKYKYCKKCISYCYDCLSVCRRPLFKFPASYEFSRGGLYEIPYYKYCCLECTYKCKDCGFKSNNHKEFYKEEGEFICCVKCKNKKNTQFSSVIYWIGDNYTYQEEPFDDYKYDPYFEDDIFLFSFYLEKLF